MLSNVVFLDRDGVINRDSAAYIKNWLEFEFIPGSLAALGELHRWGLVVIIITNQSMINRGISSRAALDDIHRRMRAAVQTHGGAIEEIYFCPHAPEENCACRKPRPGMIQRAQAAHDIDLKTAVMVGDSAKDIETARRAGCGQTVLVQTGNGKAACRTLADRNIHPDHKAENLKTAVSWILAHRPPFTDPV